MLFPDIYAKSGKWFRRGGEMFRPPLATKHWSEKPNDFRAHVDRQGRRQV
jgi:hypothetical protein